MTTHLPLVRAALVVSAALACPTLATAQEPKLAPPGKDGVRRVGVFIGVQTYTSKQVPRLRAPERDARDMEEALRTACDLGRTHVLTNKDATLAAITDVIAKQLPQQTRPGDEVIIYWSGHGLHLPETDAKAVRSVRLFLIPHDGDPATTDSVLRTMVRDTTFRDWILALEGRRVVVILDTCHSGAVPAKAGAKPVEVKSFPPPPPPSGLTPRAIGRFPDHFLADAMKGVRGGAAGLWVLASSRAEQPSFERTRGDHGVMTYYLLDAIATEKKGQPLTVVDVAKLLAAKVPAYVKEEYEAEQNPVFDGPTDPAALLRR